MATILAVGTLGHPRNHRIQVPIARHLLKETSPTETLKRTKNVFTRGRLRTKNDIGVFGGCVSVSDKKQSGQSKRPQYGNLVSGGFLKPQAACTNVSAVAYC